MGKSERVFAGNKSSGGFPMWGKSPLLLFVGEWCQRMTIPILRWFHSVSKVWASIQYW